MYSNMYLHTVVIVRCLELLLCSVALRLYLIKTHYCILSLNEIRKEIGVNLKIVIE